MVKVTLRVISRKSGKQVLKHIFRESKGTALSTRMNENVQETK